jgi:hypothetical protein
MAGWIRAFAPLFVALIAAGTAVGSGSAQLQSKSCTLKMNAEPVYLTFAGPGALSGCRQYTNSLQRRYLGKLKGSVYCGFMSVPTGKNFSFFSVLIRSTDSYAGSSICDIYTRDTNWLPVK